MTTTNKKLEGNRRNKAIESIQSSLQLLPLIMDNIPQAVFWKDRDLVYLGCNRAFAEDAGFSSPEEIIGKTDYDMPWKEQAELYRADDCLVMEKGQPKLNYEEPQTTPDGSTIWLRTSKIPVQEGGKIVAVLGMYEDITEYKKAQEVTVGERQRFQTILESIRIPTIISRLSDGQVLYANQAIARISQVDLDKLIGFRTGNFYVNPEDQEKIRAALRTSGHVDDFEVQFRRTDGSTYWALLSSRIVKYEGENCVLSSYMDITTRKQVEAALKAHDEFSQKQSALFAELAHSEALYSGDLQAAFAEVTEAAASALHVQRSSIWYYNDDRTAIRCMDLYEEGKGHSSGIVLSKSDFPAYFKALEDEKVIAAENAHTDPATCEFSASYLTPLGINSMLDAPIRLRGRVIGVICNEHVGPIRPWTTEEQNFAGTIVDFVTVAVETQERKRVEEDLLLRDRALTSSLTAVFIIGLDFKPIYANNTFLKMTGYSYEEAMQLAVPNLTGHPEGVKRIDEAMQAQGFFVGEEPVKRKDGTIFPTSFATSFINNAEGKPVAIQSSFFDISERKQAEEAVRESEERFRRFTEATNEGLVFHEQGRIIDANPAGLAMFGLTEASNFIGRNLLEFVLPEFHRLIVEKMQMQDVPPYEVQCIRADGSTFPVETATRTYQLGERVIRATSIRDITERKQAEQALRDSEARYSAVVTQAQDGIVIIQDNILQFVNEAMGEMLGYTAAEMVNTPIINYIAPESRPLIVNRIKARLAGEEVPPVYEARLQRKDGTLVDCELSAGIIEYRSRPADVGMIRDISERKQAEEALRAHDEFSQQRSSVFAELARSEALYSGDLQAAFAEVTEAAARTLNIQRSSIWYYNDDHTEIRCMDLFEQGKGHSSGIVLGKADFPSYFKALEDEKVIAAENAHTHPATCEFSAVYLTPLGINSMLDAPIRLRGRVIGVICNEHVGPFRSWTTEEQNFASTIVDFVTVAVETQERKQAEAELQQSEANLSSALQVAKMGHWEYDVATGMFTFNDQYYSLHGTTAEKAGGYHMSVQKFAQEYVYPEDAASVGMSTQQAIETTDPNFQIQIEARIMHTDGKPRWVTVWFRVEKDAQGRTIKLHGVNQDITERKQLQQEIETALERRGRQVELSTRVAQSIATASSLQELYERVVAQVKEQFDYYHTQILRYDSVLDAVVLVNGYGEVGTRMLADGHRLPMGEGLIGTAAASGETVLRSVLQNDPSWHPNPLLPETKGEIAVPIKLGETVLGVLDVQSNVAGALDAEDQLLLEGLCGQIATALESTRLREQMSERLEEINRLYRAMSHEGWQSYRGSTDLPTGLMYDQSGLRPVPDSGLAEELFAKVPLTVPGGEVIGTLAVADDPRRPISPDDEEFLQQVSEQVALALESARLFEQTQKALGEVRRRASELETVATVSTTASGALDPDVLLQSVVNLTKERFGLYHAHIYLFDQDRNELVLTAGAGEVGRKMLAEGWSIPVDHELSIAANAYRKQQSVVANDLHHDEKSGFLSNRLLPNTRSEMALPLVVGDQVLGVFDVQSETANYFSSEDVNIYTTLASQVAVALQNARLYVEQARTVAQLRELDKLKSSFLANMSHELRTPLNSILGFADVILEELDGPLTENMNNDLRLIQKNGQHLLHLINDVLDMAKIEAGRMNLSPERFTAYEVLEEVTSITSTLASEKNLALFIDEESDRKVEIYADRTRLRQVMINLVNNAIKFTEAGKISLKLDSLPGARVLISVKDTGIGIPPDKLEPIFQEFTQVDASSTRKAGGTGLGLPISRRLVEMHGGRLWADSTGVPGEGSTFFVELPVEARITETVEKQVK